MGEGEYGGNGSVHWYGLHRVDRNHGHSNHSFHEVDEYPDSGGNFKVYVFDVNPGDVTYDTLTKTLTVEVPIKHDPSKYTQQVRVEWPDPPLGWSPGGQAAGGTTAGGGTGR